MTPVDDFQRHTSRGGGWNATYNYRTVVVPGHEVFTNIMGCFHELRRIYAGE